MADSVGGPFPIPGQADVGARFLRADLHVHTYGASTDVRDTEATPERVVEQAALRGIEMLAVTDHNTIAAVEASIEAGRQRGIFVIAGVELTAAEGHLLAYFDPDHLDVFRDWFARLRFETDAVGDRHLLDPMHALVATVGQAGGIAIPAHVGRSGSGCLVKAPRKSQDALIASPHVLAIEVDGPDEFAWFSDADATAGSEKRREQLAARVEALGEVQGPRLPKLYFSDAHSLDAIGRNRQGEERLTRIKMGEPSFAAFRLALQDPEARIRLEDELPRSYPRIVGARIIGGFLDGQEIPFSPNLTCLIGGRGTGKSTVLEAVRCACLSKPHERESDGEAGWPHSVQLVYQDSFGERHYVQRTSSGETVGLVNGAAIPMTVPIEGYAQDRVAEIIRSYRNNPELLTQFLDGFADLADINSRLADTRRSLRENAEQLLPLADAAQRKERATMSLAEAELKLKAVESSNLKEALGFRRQVMKERVLRENIRARVEEIKLVIDQIDSAVDATRLSAQAEVDQSESSAGKAYLVGSDDDPGLLPLTRGLDGLLAAWKSEGVAHLAAALPAIQAKLDGWADFERRVEARIQKIVQDLRENGVDANQAEMNRLTQQESNARAAIKQADIDLEAAKTLAAVRRKQLADYRQQQTSRYHLRSTSTAALTGLLNGSLREFKVKIGFSEATRVDDYERWIRGAIGQRAFKSERMTAFCRAVHPIDLAAAVRTKQVKTIVDLVDGRGVRYFNKAEDANDFLALFSQANLHELEGLQRSDLPEITLTTQVDGKPTVVRFDHLSLGQKASILLGALLFADDDKPLIIDQPEDHLDSAFIFETVVATLRSRKEKRQIILATHNANIAVLGDAEMIVPLQGYQGRGIVRDPGSVDSKATSARACKILEGGRSAYTRRGEMYGLESAETP